MIVKISIPPDSSLHATYLMISVKLEARVGAEAMTTDVFPCKLFYITVPE